MGIAVRNEGNISSAINVTPMVDVMLVLLIIFMVITPMLQNKVQIDMAKVDNPTTMPDADKEDAIVVAVTRDGGCLPGTEQDIARASLARRFARSWPTSPARRSSFAPMRARSIRAVEDAIDAVRTAGVDDVGLLTQKREGNLSRRRVTFALRRFFNDFEQTRSFKPWQ